MDGEVSVMDGHRCPIDGEDEEDKEEEAKGKDKWRTSFLIEYHGEADLEDVDPHCQQDANTTVRMICHTISHSIHTFSIPSAFCLAFCLEFRTIYRQTDGWWMHGGTTLYAYIVV